MTLDLSRVYSQEIKFISKLSFLDSTWQISNAYTASFALISAKRISTSVAFLRIGFRNKPLPYLSMEIGSMAIADSIIRLLDGAIAKESIESESFDENLLEYPQYTEPYDFNGDKVPDILYSGNHQAINKWRRKKSLNLTKELRPDLFKKVNLSKADKKLLDEDKEKAAKWELAAIEKGKKFIK